MTKTNKNLTNFCALIFLILNSATAQPGSWNRIEFSPSSTNSRMSWCKIEYANFGGIISQRTEFDHRLHYPEFETTTEQNGNFSLENIPYNDYIVIYKKTSFGCHNNLVTFKEGIKMLKAIRAIYDNGKVELLAKEPSGKYEVVIVFLGTLPDDEVEDMILAKQLGLEADYEKALSALKLSETIKADQLRERLKEKLVG